MQNMFGLLRRYRAVIILVVIYWAVRMVNLSGLPIFNDEAIYLDWGWREIHTPGYLYYSLYDAKPPLLMWIFGVAASVLPDPLTSGRIVGIFFGFCTLLGVYAIGLRFFSPRIALLAGLFTIANPLLSFFERQVLMESALGASGIWTLYAFLRYCETKRPTWAVCVGLFVGFGFFVKTNALVFGCAVIIISIGLLIRRRFTVQEASILFGTVTFVFLLVVLPLLSQPDFWKTIHTMNRYTLSVTELASFPYGLWIEHVQKMFIIAIFHITPLLAVSACYGLYLLASQRHFFHKITGIWFMVCAVLVLISARTVIERYVVSFIPLLGIFAAYQYDRFMRQGYVPAKRILGITLVLSFSCTVFQVMSPVSSIRFLSGISPLALREYVYGTTSGIGIREAVNYIREQSAGEEVFVGMALHTGNPESGIIATVLKDPFLTAGYLDMQYMENGVDSVDCLVAPVPVYFISRDEDTAGLERFMDKKKTVINPYAGNSIGIYKLRSPCEGRTQTLYFASPR